MYIDIQHLQCLVLGTNISLCQTIPAFFTLCKIHSEDVDGESKLRLPLPPTLEQCGADMERTTGRDVEDLFDVPAMAVQCILMLGSQFLLFLNGWVIPVPISEG